MSHSGFVLRQIVHDLRVGMLLRPGLLVLAAGTLGVTLSLAEKHSPAAFAWAKPLGVVDASSAQVLLGTIAGSMLTLLALVYSVFLVAMTLVSMQYSPRVLAELTGDSVSQTTLGMLSGTFLYALLVLRSVHGDPDAFVAPLSVALAIFFAVASIGALLAFLHHISQSIQANALIHRLATLTRDVIVEEFPAGAPASEDGAVSAYAGPPEGAAPIVLKVSGYIQLLDTDGLIALAASRGVTIELRRAVGEFVVEGAPIGYVIGAGTDGVAAQVGELFDIGHARTLQQDVEYGFRRIVDIGLKAISPAVNDPSTGVTCVDNLAGLLSFAATRRDPERQVISGKGRVVFARTTFVRLVGLAFAQLRQYAQGDMAVSLRLLKAIHDVAQTTNDPARRAALKREADLVRGGFSTSFQADDRLELDRRCAALDRIFGGEALESRRPAFAAVATPRCGSQQKSVRWARAYATRSGVTQRLS